jgi:hypothetical protein
MVASDLLYQLFEGSIALEQLASSVFRNGAIDRNMTAVARTLNSLRRELHVEFSIRAAFGAASPCADFEQKLSEPAAQKETPP